MLDLTLPTANCQLTLPSRYPLRHSPRALHFVHALYHLLHLLKLLDELIDLADVVTAAFSQAQAAFAV